MDFVVLSSSRGTTFQAVIDRMKDGSLTAKCLGLVTDKEDRGCIVKAKEVHLPIKVVVKQFGEDHSLYDSRVDQAVSELISSIEGTNTVIACMGWMSIFSSSFIKQWKGRILNVHPALLPQHGGKGMYGMRVHEEVLKSGDRESGMTIHVMDEGVDTGPILIQKTCEVEDADTPDDLKKKVQALEKEWYPKVLQMIEEGEIVLP